MTFWGRIGATIVGVQAWAPALARADVVGPCPPGFRTSHSGCHPEWPELLGLGVCLVIGLSIVGLILWRRTRRKGADEPDHF